MNAFIPSCPFFRNSFTTIPTSPTSPSRIHRPSVCNPANPPVLATLDESTENTAYPSQPKPVTTQPVTTQPATTPQSETSLISIVEYCKGSPWTFTGKRVYIVDMKASECDVLENKTFFPSTFRFPESILAVCLPDAWPHSVAAGYHHWVKWHISRHIFRNAYYVLGTTSLLHSLGLGTGQALALGATLKWVLKDGLGMGTKLLVSTNLASIVDADPKRWRFIGDSFMAVSALVEILSVANPAYFLLFGTVAALLKEAGGAMSGPAYRVFLDSFAISSNIGDVSSRGEAQVVIGNLIGLGLGVAAKTFLDSQPSVDRLLPTLAFFAVLAVGHLGSTYNAISSVRLRTLNWQRLNIIIDEYLSTGTVPSVETVNRSESFLYALSPHDSSKRLRVGVSLLEFVECGRDVSAALRNRKDRFVVAYNKDCVGIVLQEDVRPEDIVQAVLQGRRLLQVVEEKQGVNDWSRAKIGELTAETYSWTCDALPSFVNGLKSQGWSLKKTLVGTEGCRYKHSPTR